MTKRLKLIIVLIVSFIIIAAFLTVFAFLPMDCGQSYLIIQEQTRARKILFAMEPNPSLEDIEAALGNDPWGNKYQVIQSEPHPVRLIRLDSINNSPPMSGIEIAFISNGPDRKSDINHDEVFNGYYGPFGDDYIIFISIVDNNNPGVSRIQYDKNIYECCNLADCYLKHRRDENF